MKLLPFPSSSLIPFSNKVSHQTFIISTPFSPHKSSLTTMSMTMNLQPHAFAGNPLISKSAKPGDPFSPTGALESLKSGLLVNTQTQPSSTPNFKVLPFRHGRPLASSSSVESSDSQPIWHLGWINLDDLKGLLRNSGFQLSGDMLVYLGSSSEDDVVYWAIDVSSESSFVSELGSKKFCFVELRTLMVATDWADLQAMGNLAIAGHVSYVSLCLSLFNTNQ